MKEIIEKIKSKLWFITIPVAALVLFSMSALKDIEASHQELETGKKLSYYLRK
jgi:ABC-type microcin C transport system permease subunit YejB